MGRLTVKIACQSKVVVRKPPMVGPKAGASSTGTPITAEAGPRSAGGKTRKMMAKADREERAAADALQHAEGDQRSLVGRDGAEAEPIVKTASAVRKTVLVPIRSLR